MSTEDNQARFDSALSSHRQISYPDDCAQIVRVAAERLDITMTVADAAFVWRLWSDQWWEARWIEGAVDDYIVQALEWFLSEGTPETEG